MSAKHTRVRITWNDAVGEIDSVTLHCEHEFHELLITDALIKLIEGNIVSPGDSFTVEEIK